MTLTDLWTGGLVGGLIGGMVVGFGCFLWGYRRGFKAGENFSRWGRGK